MIIGALELGGLKTICAIGNESGEVMESHEIATKEPKETVQEALSYFSGKEIHALGIASFGPIDLKTTSSTYGYITTTPKMAWQNFPLLPTFKEALDIPIGFETDVNASCLGEASYGVAKNNDTCIYIALRTGIGVGVMVNRRLLHGMQHPEAGHVFVTRFPDDPFEGSCPFHSGKRIKLGFRENYIVQNCLEGLASGPAIERRYGKPAKSLVNIPSVWEMEAFYLSQAIYDYILTLSPERIIIGGTVPHGDELLVPLRRRVKELLGDYIKADQLQDMDNYIVSSQLEDEAGIKGGFRLGIRAYEKCIHRW